MKAQSVGIGASNPHPSARLEVASTQQGILIPRLTTAQRNAITTPAHSLLIFNVDNFCIEAYDSITQQWYAISCPKSCPVCDTCRTPTINSLSASQAGVCVGDTVKLYADVSGMHWIVVNLPSGWYMLSQGDTTIMLAGTQGTVYVIACNDCGCSRDSISFGSGNAPVISATVSPSPACPLDTVTLSASSSVGTINWTWLLPSGWVANGSTSAAVVEAYQPVPTGGSPDTFTVIGCNGCGCDTQRVVLAYTPSSLTANLSGLSSACVGDTLIFYANVSGYAGQYSTQWSFPAGWTVVSSDNDSLVVIVNSSGTVALQTCDSCSCVYDTIQVGTYNCFTCLAIGGTGNDEARGIIQTRDGNYVIVGFTNSWGNGGDDIYLLKVDMAGNILWSTTIGGSANDRGYDVIETRDGGLAIMGTTRSFGAGGWDMYVVKTDANGNVQWTTTIGGGGNEIRDGTIRELPDGSLIVGGSEWSAGFGSGNTDVYIARLTSSGSLLWTIAGGTANGDFASYITDIPGTPYFVGVGETEVDGNTDKFYFVKFDSLGNVIWSLKIGGSNPDQGRDIIALPDGFVTAVGGTRSFGQGNFDMYFIQIDTGAGNINWTTTVGLSSSIEYGHAILGYKNTIIGAGYTNNASVGAGGEDAYFVGLEASTGSLLWTRTIGTTGNERIYEAIIDNSNYIVSVGYTDVNGNTDIFLVRLKPNGFFQCTSGCLSGSGGTTASGGNRAAVGSFNSGGNTSTGGSNANGGGTPTNLCQ